MIPVIALVGRPNVGKSTLFNRLTRSRDALVADAPGLTRDRRYGRGAHHGRPFMVIDTGGVSGEAEGLDQLITEQALKAVDEADVVFFLVDARGGLTAGDEAIAETLRGRGKRVVLVVNKAEGLEPQLATAEFHALGLGEPHPVSAEHGQGVGALLETALAPFPEPEEAPDEAERGPVVAVVGRPNVGKSTLINRLVGEERVVAFDRPGTTRDAIDVPFQWEGKDYTLVDTAGVRRRSRVDEAVEKFSIVKTLQAIDRANVVVLVIDAREGLVDQDLHLLGYILDAGRALVIAINKWDGLDPDHKARVKADVQRRLGFAEFAEVLYLSALHGTGVGHLMEVVDEAFASAVARFPTPRLTRLLEDAVSVHPPPLVRGRRIKLRYAHQGGANPPLIVIHGNQVERVPAAYRRYLANTFRKHLGLTGTPLRIEFKGGENPYAGRRNRLSERQIRKRKRLLRHVKKQKRR